MGNVLSIYAKLFEYCPAILFVIYLIKFKIGKYLMIISKYMTKIHNSF